MSPALSQSSKAQWDQDSHGKHLRVTFSFFCGQVDECAQSGILLVDKVSGPGIRQSTRNIGDATCPNLHQILRDIMQPRWKRLVLNDTLDLD